MLRARGGRVLSVLGGWQGRVARPSPPPLHFLTSSPLLHIASSPPHHFPSSPLRHFHTSPLQAHTCELTSKRYGVERGKYSQVNESHLQFFRDLLGPHRTVVGEDELQRHNTDYQGSVRGASPLLLRPTTTQEVSTILAYCNQHNLAVCPQGGNTGVVGGSIPVFDEVIVSTSLMNQVESVDTWSGAVTCQAGCVLEALDQHVAQFGLTIPLDLGSKGSCQIGGNISTNAGGLRVLRYGGLHGSVMGLEAVLACGEVVDCLSAMKKDNTGYDLKHLFIGSEGTLGIVTKVVISCPPRPASVHLAFLGLATFEDVLSTYKSAKSQLGEILSSFELMDSVTLDSVEENLKLKSPIAKHPFYLLVETSGSNADHDAEKVDNFVNDALRTGIVKDGTVVTEPSRIAAVWSLRERVFEALLMDGYGYENDISLPLPVFYKLVEDMRRRLGSDVVRCTGLGHMGDGNLHLAVTTRQYDEDVLKRIVPTLFEWTAQYKGSISAEHGVGLRKRNYIHYSKSEASIRLMKQVKQLMDPKGILNPYKVLPEE